MNMLRPTTFLSRSLAPILHVVLGITVLVASTRAGYAQDAQLMTRAIDDLAARLVEKLPKQRPLRLAVPSFADLENGRKTALGKYLANELASAIVEKGGVDLAERADNSLDQLIDEVRLSESGLVDKETARKLKLKGVDVIAACSMTVFETYVALNCRAIEAGSGAVLAAARSRLAIDSDVKILLTKSLGDSEGGSGQAGGSDEKKGGAQENGKPGLAAAKGLNIRAEQFLFELKYCKKSGTSVICSFMVTNEGEERWLVVDARFGRIVDEDGNEAPVAQATLGAQKGTDGSGALRIDMIPGVPLKMTWTFQGSLAQSRSARAVELYFMAAETAAWPSKEWSVVRFFNIALDTR